MTWPLGVRLSGTYLVFVTQPLAHSVRLTGFCDLGLAVLGETYLVFMTRSLAVLGETYLVFMTRSLAVLH